MDLNEQTPTPDAPRGGASGDASTPGPERLAASRRAMLRAGMIGVPVVTTLMARPAWAQTSCFSLATAESVQAAGFVGSSYQRALANSECEEGDTAAAWLEAYALMLEMEQRRQPGGPVIGGGSSPFAGGGSAAAGGGRALGLQLQDAIRNNPGRGPVSVGAGRGPGQGQGQGPGQGAGGEPGTGGGDPAQPLTVAMLAAQTGELTIRSVGGTILYLGTYAQAFGRGQTVHFDEVLGSGFASEQVFAAAFLNALNRDNGNRRYRDYPLSMDEVVGLHNGDTVGGKRWSPAEAVAYLSTTMV